MHRLDAGGQGKLGKAVGILDLFRVFLGDFFFAGLQNFFQIEIFDHPADDGKIIRNAVLFSEFGIKALQASTPDSPANRRFHTVGTSSPMEVTMPTPVTTTRRIVFVHNMYKNLFPGQGDLLSGRLSMGSD